MADTRIRHIQLSLPIFAMLALGCHDSTQPKRPVVQLAEHSAAVEVGDSLQLSLLPVLPPGYVPSVTWASRDSAVAGVELDGAAMATVVGIHAGQATIVAAGAGATDSATITVTAATP